METLIYPISTADTFANLYVPFGTYIYRHNPDNIKLNNRNFDITINQKAELSVFNGNFPRVMLNSITIYLEGINIPGTAS